MPYELSIYKNRLESYFEKWVERFKDDPLREDAFKRAFRIHQMLKEITPLEDASFVPSDSVIREFIGGSSLEYH
jgi:uridine kinase